jgi:Methyltransferase domain
MGWKTTVAKGAVKRLVPFMPLLRKLKRRYAGYQESPANFDWTLDNAVGIFAEIAAAGVSLEGAHVVEIGSGWLPVIPFLFRIKGASSVILTDIDPYLDDVSFGIARRYMLDNLDTIAARTGFDTERARDFLQKAQTIGQAGFDYRCPFEPQSIGDSSIDIVYSRTVLEHIPPAVIVALLRGLAPKLKPQAIMVHDVDESDHLEHGDKSISRVNFLTLSDGIWSLVNRCWDYQNRLRHHEFLPLFHEAGYDVVKESAWTDPKVMAVLPSLKLSPPYDQMSHKQIAVMHSVFVLKHMR